VLTDANGISLAITLSGANRHDMKMFDATLDALVVRRPSPKKVPQHLCNDKGYDYPEIRRSAARRGYIAHIKSRGQEEQERKKNPRYKARRWVVERSNRWHNLFRRLKIRYEVHAENYLGFVQFASAIISWRKVAA
jgi:transposase